MAAREPISLPGVAATDSGRTASHGRASFVMILRGRNLTGWLHLWIGLAALVAVTTDCVAPVDKEESQHKQERARAMLAAAHAHEINMFGELSGADDVRYFERSAVSLRQHSFTEIGADMDPNLDSAGQHIVFASTRHNARPNLYIKSTEGVAVTQLTSDPASDVQPVFAPDDRRVAFASDRSGNWDVWIVSVDGGPPVQVTHGASDDVHPSWSPDGTKLVYCSLPAGSGQWELWITDVSAGATRRFIGYGLFPEWSPTGDTILYQRARERGSRWFGVWTLTLVNGEPRYPTELAWSSELAYTLPTWSPDGTRIAYAAVRGPSETKTNSNGPSATSDIWMMAEDGRGTVRLTDGHTVNRAPAFSPDGQIYFCSKRAGHENIWSLLPPQTPAPRFPGDQMTAKPIEADGVSHILDPSPVRKGGNKDDL